MFLTCKNVQENKYIILTLRKNLVLKVPCDPSILVKFFNSDVKSVFILSWKVHFLFTIENKQKPHLTAKLQITSRIRVIYYYVCV